MNLENPASMRILVVDDNPEVRAGTRRVLCGAGYQVVEAATGEEAVTLVGEMHPDLVLMDVSLPGISGLEAVRLIKGDPQLEAIFVVILSASARSSERQVSGLEGGADGYIVRPIPNQELLARVNAFLRLKKMADALRASEALFANSFEYAPIGMALVATDGRWLKVNRALCTLLGRSEAELLAGTFQQITHAADLATDQECRTRLIAGELPSCDLESRYLHRDGNLITVSLSISLVRDNRGAPLYFVAHMQDISVRKRAEQKLQAALENEIILRREIHHRVKNNLQVVMSLLYLQSLEMADPKTLEVLRESQSRVRSMALIYELLGGSKPLAKVDLGAYTRRLVADLFTAYRVSSDSMTIIIQAAGLSLDLDTAIPCGLIVNELVSNAFKYAFPPGRAGSISIVFQRADPGQLQLCVNDDGLGLPRGFDLENARTMGLKLVRDLTRQLGGSVEFANERGTSVTLTFPDPEAIAAAPPL